jgi:hypothetical protein
MVTTVCKKIICRILWKCGKVKIFGNSSTNQNSMHEEIKIRLSQGMPAANCSGIICLPIWYLRTSGLEYTKLCCIVASLL